MKRLCLIAVLLAAGAAKAGQAAPIFDRTALMAPGSETSDDVQRVPVPRDTNAPKGSIVLIGGRVFDGTGQAARPATVVISGKRIVAILSPGSREWPADAKVIDVAGKTVMPGLIDAHVHLTYVEAFGKPPELSAESESDATLRAILRMRILLQSGITSVRDMASNGQVPFVLKRWQAQGRVEGPRIFPVGQLITSIGGHGTENFIQRSAPAYPASTVRVASGPDGWRDAVRTQFAQGADTIKLASHFSQAEIDAAVAEAHSLGLPVAVDAETEFIDMAVKAGADDIEHPLPRSDATIAQMAKQGVMAVPTLVPYRYINALMGGYYGTTSRRFTIDDATIFAIARKMRRAGIKLGVGTDLVIDWVKYFPQAYIDELKNFSVIGYTPAEALVAATRTNAEILHMGDRIGTLQAGKLADVIVVDGRPDVDLQDLSRIDTVIVNGRVAVAGGRIQVPPHEQPASPILVFP